MSERTISVVAESLAKICDPHSGGLSAPFSWRRNGIDGVAATNRAVFVFIAGDHVGAADIGELRRAKISGHMSKYKVIKGSAQGTGFAELVARAGVVTPGREECTCEEVPPCADCDGDGEIKCGDCGEYRSCHTCDGLGYMRQDRARIEAACPYCSIDEYERIRPGYLAGCLVDRAILARALNAVRACCGHPGPCAITSKARHGKSGEIVEITGPRWSILLAGMYDGRGDEPVYPETGTKEVI